MKPKECWTTPLLPWALIGPHLCVRRENQTWILEHQSASAAPTIGLRGNIEARRSSSQARLRSSS